MSTNTTQPRQPPYGYPPYARAQGSAAAGTGPLRTIWARRSASWA